MSPLVGAAIALVVGVFASIAAAENGDPNNSIKPADFLIPREDLSTQGTDPFLFIGKVVDENHPRWKAYRVTMDRFPTTSSCLLSEEQNKNVQNLLAFDWQAMTSFREIEVCVFRIARNFDDVDLLRAWLVAQGFRIIDIGRRYSGEPPGKFEDEPVYRQEAFWAPDELDDKTRIYDVMPPLDRWIWFGASQNFGLQIQLSRAYKPVGVHASVRVN